MPGEMKEEHILIYSNTSSTKQTLYYNLYLFFKSGYNNERYFHFCVHSFTLLYIRCRSGHIYLLLIPVPVKEAFAYICTTSF